MKTRHRKGDYLSQPARLLEIDARLREGKHPSHAQLGKELGVSARTIQRDMDYLRDTIGAPLEYDAKQKGWYYTEETFFLPSVLASAQDLQALLLIRQAIGQYEGTPYAEAAKRAFALIEKALPERERLSAEWIRSKVAFTDFPPAEIKKEVWAAVLESLRTQRTLAMTYAKPGAKARTAQGRSLRADRLRRRLVPVHARPQDRVPPHLLARPDPKRRSHGKSHFRHLGYFDLQSYVRKGFGGLQADGEPTRTVRITFKKEASQPAAERKWHPEQRETWDRDGRLTIEIETSALFRVLRRLGGASHWIQRVVLEN